MNHSEHSSFREKLIEHLFIGELLKLSWMGFGCTLEVASPEVDNAGYDLIVEDNGVVRHIQIKASYVGSKTASQKVHARLSEKPSGCVTWIYFNEDTLELGPFLFFGSLPGEKLPSLDGLKVAKHTKGNQSGFKAERPNIRVLPKSWFKNFSSIDEVYEALFGAPFNGLHTTRV
ncbi:hypothetical protein [Vreelandella neptunia]|uniref:PD(D/E)XK endonuclease domain-containing protein n=1 Tax=Vreelandella neptunia TaxID=115551 RepID=A0ABS9SAC5_9GAMM|nr:hypothetical protein [Halomonas neptunia]MCH4813071.1 hypothetical protein [Halomonas neptunia]